MLQCGNSRVESIYCVETRNVPAYILATALFGTGNPKKKKIKTLFRNTQSYKKKVKVSMEQIILI